MAVRWYALAMLKRISRGGGTGGGAGA